MKVNEPKWGSDIGFDNDLRKYALYNFHKHYVSLHNCQNLAMTVFKKKLKKNDNL